MNLYILVEGARAESILYPMWINYCQPTFRTLRFPEDAQSDSDGYYIISGYGFPSVYTHIENSIATINDCENFDFFVVAVDAEELSYQERYDEIKEKINSSQLNRRCKPIIIIQNCCLETWLLGNNTVIRTHIPIDENFKKYFEWFDVTSNDPELMLSDGQNYTRAQYHEKYLRAALTACRGRGYQKGRPHSCGSLEYWTHLLNRLAIYPDHIPSFKIFVDFFSNPELFRTDG